MYRVIYKFKDLKDSDHIYNVGDTFPWDGRKVSTKRINELSTKKNLIGVPVIEPVYEDDEEPTVESVEEVEEMEEEKNEVE